VNRKIDPDDLIDVGEVQAILRLSQPNAVSLYLKRYDDMPRPIVVRSNGKTRLWLRQEIETWAKNRGRKK
jgi:predicted DNA-binding transcriptional regulator AlpA